MEKYLVFAYGSNMNFEYLVNYFNTQGKKFSLKKIGIGELKGYKLSWSVYSKTWNCGVLNVINSNDDSVWGVIYEVDENTLYLLDKKEGCPKKYVRELLPVYVSNEEVLAYVYKANPSHTTANFWPNLDYKKIVLEGAIANSLPQDYVQKLEKNVPVCHVKDKSNSGHKIAIYSGSGVGGQTLQTWCMLFEKYNIGTLEILYSHQFTLNRLRNYDLIILPGGSGKSICHGLGDIGKENIREYVKSGGNLLGVCAGAFAISAQYQVYIGLAPLKFNKSYSYKNDFLVNVLILEAGSKFVRVKPHQLVPVVYHNGPLFYHDEVFYYKDVSDFQVLAVFDENIPFEEIKDIAGKPAIWMNKYGRGNVFGVSPHFERTPGQEYVIVNLISEILNLK